MDADHQQERFPKQKDFNHYIAGFVDGEGCFCVVMKRHSSTKFGWLIDPAFHLYQHKDNILVLEMIKETFKTGSFNEKSGSPNVIVYTIDNRVALQQKLIPFFNRYRLIVKKKDFELFSQIVKLLNQGLHQDKKGFLQIVDLAFQMNQHGKQRKYSKQDILNVMEKSSENTRQTPIKRG